MLLCLLQVLRIAGAGGAGGDELCASLYAGDAGDAGGDALYTGGDALWGRRAGYWGRCARRLSWAGSVCWRFWMCWTILAGVFDIFSLLLEGHKKGEQVFKHIIVES